MINTLKGKVGNIFVSMSCMFEEVTIKVHVYFLKELVVNCEPDLHNCSLESLIVNIVTVLGLRHLTLLRESKFLINDLVKANEPSHQKNNLTFFF